MHTVAPELLARIEANIRVTESGCHEWLGHVKKLGNVPLVHVVKGEGATTSVRLVLWRVAHPDETRSKVFLLPSCGNVRCVRLADGHLINSTARCGPRGGDPGRQVERSRQKAEAKAERDRLIAATLATHKAAKAEREAAKAERERPNGECAAKPTASRKQDPVSVDLALGPRHEGEARTIANESAADEHDRQRHRRNYERLERQAERAGTMLAPEFTERSWHYRRAMSDRPIRTSLPKHRHEPIRPPTVEELEGVAECV